MTKQTCSQTLLELGAFLQPLMRIFIGHVQKNPGVYFFNIKRNISSKSKRRHQMQIT